MVFVIVFCEDDTEPLIGEHQHNLSLELCSENVPRSVGEDDGEGWRGCEGISPKRQ